MEKEPPPISSPLPHEVIELILSRVPAQSLLRFMVVCKLWRSTICDLRFTELHRRHSQKRISGCYFAFVSLGEDKATVRFNSHSRCRVPPPMQLKFKTVFSSPILNRYYCVSMSPILNGLVCLYSDLNGPHALIMNISTREILHLPKTTLGGRRCIGTRYSIGYDPVTNKYIVLHYGKRIDKDPISEVFTLGTTSWRYCANTPNMIMKSSKTSPCLNGRIYWLTFEGGDKFLISFDVSGEVYHTTKFSLPLCHLSNLFSLGGDLAAVLFRGMKEGIEVLKMEQFNNELKVVGKRKIAFTPSFKFSGGLSVLGISPNGEIVLQDVGELKRTYYLDLDDCQGAWKEKFYYRDFYQSERSEVTTYHVENMFRLSDLSLAAESEIFRESKPENFGTRILAADNCRKEAERRRNKRKEGTSEPENFGGRVFAIVTDENRKKKKKKKKEKGKKRE